MPWGDINKNNGFGTYDIYLASDLSSFYLMGETWGVVGTFNDWGTTHDIPMSPINDD